MKNKTNFIGFRLGDLRRRLEKHIERLQKEGYENADISSFIRDAIREKIDRDEETLWSLTPRKTDLVDGSEPPPYAENEPPKRTNRTENS